MKIDILGVKVDAIRKDELEESLTRIFALRKKSYIFTPNTEFVMHAQKDDEFKQVLNSSSINLPDGIGLLWAAKFNSLKVPATPVLGQIITIMLWIITIFSIIFYPKFLKKPIPERIPGSDFVWPLAKFAADNKLKIFLLGGASTIAERAALKLQTDIYGLKIAGVSALDPKDRDRILSLINKSRADILLVAYGAPKQEIWLKNNLSETCCKLGVGVGGTFDFLAGTRKRAPQFIRAIGLEWLYRLILEPKRIKRQLTIPRLGLTMLMNKLSNK